MGKRATIFVAARTRPHPRTLEAARLGAKVTVVEYLDTILGGMDGDVSKQFQRMLAKQGMDFKLGAKVTGVQKSGSGAKVTFEPVKGGDATTIDATSC